MIELVVFTTDPERVAAVMQGGASAIFVDWEQRGKADRQAGTDTEINTLGIADLARVRRATTGPILCRLNALHDDTSREIEAAIDHGASELILPMARTHSEIERFLEMVAGRCPAGALIETVGACGCASRIDSMGLSRVYIGLNDLSIDRGGGSIFEAMWDGTVERVRADVVNTPLGVGGLTLNGFGAPLPGGLLLGEILRLGASFSFLRRSFWRDLGTGDPAEGIRDILAHVAKLERRSAEEIQTDHAQFIAAARSLSQL